MNYINKKIVLLFSLLSTTSYFPILNADVATPDIGTFLEEKIQRGVTRGIESGRQILSNYINEKTINKVTHNAVLKATGAGILVGSCVKLIFPGISTLIDTRIESSIPDQTEEKKKLLQFNRHKAWLKIGTGSLFALLGGLLTHNSSAINNWIHAVPTPAPIPTTSV